MNMIEEKRVCVKVKEMMNGKKGSFLVGEVEMADKAWFHNSFIGLIIYLGCLFITLKGSLLEHFLIK
jgi:hypothetical protein